MADTFKLTNREVLNSSRAFNTLGQVKLPAKAAYAIAKAGNKISDLETTIRAVQQKLWEKYGDKDEAGKLKVDPTNNTISFAPEQAEAFNKELDGLLSETNELTGLRKVLLSELGDAKVEPAALAELDWLFSDA